MREVASCFDAYAVHQGDHGVTVEWAAALGIQEEIADQLIQEEWEIIGITSSKEEFTRKLCKTGVPEGRPAAAWHKLLQGINSLQRSYSCYFSLFHLVMAPRPVSLLPKTPQ